MLHQLRKPSLKSLMFPLNSFKYYIFSKKENKYFNGFGFNSGLKYADSFENEVVAENTIIALGLDRDDIIIEKING